MPLTRIVSVIGKECGSEKASLPWKIKNATVLSLKEKPPMREEPVRGGGLPYSGVQGGAREGSGVVVRKDETTRACRAHTVCVQRGAILLMLAFALLLPVVTVIVVEGHRRRALARTTRLPAPFGGTLTLTLPSRIRLYSARLSKTYAMLSSRLRPAGIARGMCALAPTECALCATVEAKRHNLLGRKLRVMGTTRKRSLGENRETRTRRYPTRATQTYASSPLPASPSASPSPDPDPQWHRHHPTSLTLRHCEQPLQIRYLIFKFNGGEMPSASCMGTQKR
ncbi:hypothetical protein FIBSPDRAFT_552381 [Athelia psychrophila]|uniref:Uncharacterized protein n=1 Tax=Athelia psychrophila TaxID=1759441 RepID=A0A166UX02_9AGAM|nr:hypothetical protein FIBSPDRAFT_552381 [Fibularhizoctonia sp. CBS 109695]